MTHLSDDTVKFTADMKARCDEQADTYLDLVIGNKHDESTLQHLLPMLSKRLGAAKDVQILDIASNAGTPAIPLARTFPHAHITCTDLSTVAVRLAEQRAKDERVLNFTAQAADAQDLNAFHNDTFHVATCILGLMFMPDHKSALREAHRVLQPGGLYVATVWGALIEFQAGQMMHQLMRQLMGNVPQNPMIPWRFGNPKVLQQDLQDAGFTDITCTPFSHPMLFSWSDLVKFLLVPNGQMKPMLSGLKAKGRENIDQEAEEILRNIVKEHEWLHHGRVQLQNTALMFTAVKAPASLKSRLPT